MLAVHVDHQLEFYLLDLLHSGQTKKPHRHQQIDKKNFDRKKLLQFDLKIVALCVLSIENRGNRKHPTFD